MDAHDPSRRGRWGPGARDAALRRTRRVARVLVVGAAALSGLFSVVAAQAFKGHGKAGAGAAGGAVASAGATTSRRATVAVAPPQRVPSIAPPQAALQPPAAAPAPAQQTPAPAQPAPAPQAAPAPQPAPAPPPVSGGS